METAIKISELTSKINELEKTVDELKKSPTQPVIDKMTNILSQKFDYRDTIINLEIKNMSKSIKLEIQETLSKAHLILEKKLDEKITQAFSNQKEKISWGLEVLRFAIVAAMFILSIKFIGG